MNLTQKAFHGFTVYADDEPRTAKNAHKFEPQERSALVFVAALAKVILSNGGDQLINAAYHGIEEAEAMDVSDAKKFDHAVKYVRSVAGDFTDGGEPIAVSDGAIDSAVQAAWANRHVMARAAQDAPDAIPGIVA